MKNRLFSKPWIAIFAKIYTSVPPNEIYRMAWPPAPYLIGGGARGPKNWGQPQNLLLPVSGGQNSFHDCARSRLQKLGANSRVAGEVLPPNPKKNKTVGRFPRDRHVKSGQNSKFTHCRYRVAPIMLLGEIWRRVFRKIRGSEIGGGAFWGLPLGGRTPNPTLVPYSPGRPEKRFLFGGIGPTLGRYGVRNLAFWCTLAYFCSKVCRQILDFLTAFYSNTSVLTTLKISRSSHEWTSSNVRSKLAKTPFDERRHSHISFGYWAVVK